MQNQVVLRVRNPLLLDASTYVSVAVMALLGVSGLPTLQLQIMALALCLTFALLYHFLFRTNYFEHRPSLYFGSQAVVMVLLFLLKSSASDAFNFLFYTLTIHAAVMLSLRAAITWTSVYFCITSVAMLVDRGSAGWFAILFYLAVFILCIIMGHTVQQTELASERNQRLVEELQETQQKLQELAVVEERNRLARDLHDSVKQQVFAISMQLSAARTALSESDKAYSSVTEAERLAQQAGAELTTLINALRPPGLESKSLADAIREYAAVWSRQNSIASEVEVDSAVSVNQQIEQALFRVLQEALANVARHSQADKVTVTLKSENGNVVLIIEDNGIGYDAEQITKGIGLDSMKERMAGVSGELQISSLKSQGTRVVATVRRS
jgi:signal transduction histidine kinase